MGEAAEICARHGVKLFLEHKNSEPAMKILMRNIGMCLFVVHKLRAQGIDNVQVNMDWQHLIMNGEHLPEYAALLASEGLLGHQHANSGWGTFDDDNMVGATAFMETLELALELRRCGYGSDGERLGFDLYPTPRTRSARSGARCCSGASSTRSRRGSTTRRCARRSSARTPSAPTRSCTRRSGGVSAGEPTARSGIDVGTSGVKGLAIDADGGGARARRGGYPLSTPRPGWAEQDPDGLVAGDRVGARAAARPRPGRRPGSG